jgi:phosphate transport system protein
VATTLERELAALRELLVTMAGEVEHQLSLAIRSVVERDSSLAEQAIAGDGLIDRREIEVDRHVIELIVRERPLARDLRFVMMAQRISPDLERVADHAVNIAKQALILNRLPPLKPFVIFPRMAETASALVREAVDAFVRGDAGAARAVIAQDAEVDAARDEVTRELLTYMMGDPSTIPRALALLLIAGSLERIGDQATNIAEQVVYLAEGEDIRHRHGTSPQA